jgi:GTPase SAR1 family protein
MLPAQPKIFYGRDKELAQVVAALVGPESARIAILGAGGMGKTSLAKAALHHPDVTENFRQHFFVAADSATTTADLADLVGSHLGLKPSKKATKMTVDYFSNSGSCLLVLDNLETVWEPTESRGDVEEFLSSLTDVGDLALIVS